MTEKLEFTERDIQRAVVSAIKLFSDPELKVRWGDINDLTMLQTLLLAINRGELQISNRKEEEHTASNDEAPSGS